MKYLPFILLILTSCSPKGHEKEKTVNNIQLCGASCKQSKHGKKPPTPLKVTRVKKKKIIPFSPSNIGIVGKMDPVLLKKCKSSILKILQCIGKSPQIVQPKKFADLCAKTPFFSQVITNCPNNLSCPDYLKCMKKQITKIGFKKP
jgi:hypothetical protein